MSNLLYDAMPHKKGEMKELPRESSKSIPEPQFKRFRNHLELFGTVTVPRLTVQLGAISRFRVKPAEPNRNRAAPNRGNTSCGS